MPTINSTERKLRLKAGLRTKIAVAASKRGVSMNQEMVFRLEQSFRDDRVISLLRAEVDRLFPGKLT